MKKVKKAIITAAGFGTRFLPITKSVPKEMLPIIDKPIIEYIVDEVIESGIEEILIIISKQKQAIIDYFSINKNLENFLIKKNQQSLNEKYNTLKNITIKYIEQEEQLGLGHAILICKDFVKDEPFAVLLGDDLFKCNVPAIKQLIDVYNKKQSMIIGTVKVDKKDYHKYGICDCKLEEDSLYKVFNLVEKPSIENSPSNIAICGRYILLPEVFEQLSKQQKSHTNEIELTDSISRTIEKVGLFAYIIDGKRYDTGNKLGYLESVVDFALDNQEIGQDFKLFLDKKQKI